MGTCGLARDFEDGSNGTTLILTTRLPLSLPASAGRSPGRAEDNVSNTPRVLHLGAWDSVAGKPYQLGPNE